MSKIVFIDAEIDPNKGKVLDIGGIKDDGSGFHSTSIADFTGFLRGSEYICGHNIFRHDFKYIRHAITDAGISDKYSIDTLFLSPLLFPARPYHKLLKDDKLQTDDVNNPLNDSMKARDLLYDEVAAFQRLDMEMKSIFYLLLRGQPAFCAFFHFIGFDIYGAADLETLIQGRFHSQICRHANINALISGHPAELAYCLALINVNDRYSVTPPWVLKSYPAVERVMFLLRSNPCLTGCGYCNEKLDSHKGLKRFFGFDSFRSYAGSPLQELAVKAAIANKSLLAVFPTGGGKSITFQLPALMSGANLHGLTVVLSPLQSLMKDQVDNLEKMGITEAVTINGLLDPIEREKSFERVENGSASILYISPESLRSRTMENLLLKRNVVRFVIDEAHCFSAWGQEFRVDYVYIGDFIKMYQEKKGLEDGIPVSCFTATAKKKVIEDIREYFREKLSVSMEVYSTDASRSNLHYKVIPRETEEEKYSTVRNLLDEKRCPSIIYVSRTYKTEKLAQRLTDDGYNAKPYHGKMDRKEKTENQNAFMRGEVPIMVATSAFGMGVDKKDVGMVIHYEISDSLENYVQEAGRAGRDETIAADCYVLFSDEDLNKHFILLNQNKLSMKEIQQVWKAVKDITRARSKVSNSALEIARNAGWDENLYEIETRVTTAIAALEDAGYLRRGQNMPRVYANGILARNAQEAITKINASGRFSEKQKTNAIRIIRKLISQRSRSYLDSDDAESRVDYISDNLGIPLQEVIEIVNLLREERILADSKDLTAFIRRKGQNQSQNILKIFMRIENYLATVIDNEEQTVNLKELNEEAEQSGCEEVSVSRLKTVLNFWRIKNWIKKQTRDHAKDTVTVLGCYDSKALKEKLLKRQELARFIVEHLFSRSGEGKDGDGYGQERIPVEFSVMELKEEYEKRLTLFDTKATLEDVEDALFYLSRIGALELEGGFLVVYNRLSIERIEKDNKKRYKAEDYQKLDQFYMNKIQQVHIVGEYARKMMDDYKAALRFVDDYFQLNYQSFLNKYFKGGRQDDIKRNITPEKFRQLFGELSPSQLNIIKDKDSKYIVVAAGPGSGKTRILAHKLASLMMMEDVKHEQMLMVTFSRSAATEFKKRLIKLIGNAASFIAIKTFHSFCFDLLGRVGTLERSDAIIKDAAAKIRSGEAETGKITKTVLVIDEAQDMDENEYELICALMDYNEDMRVIAVGDDDQNIFEFRGSDSKYMERLIREKNAVMYELVDNYRSKMNLVDFSNQFAKGISHRLKHTQIVAMQKGNGRIKIVRYSSDNLIAPLVKDIVSTELAGTTCVLARTNEEAAQVTGLLKMNGIPARLIQSNDEFNLYNLLEIRTFLDHLLLDRDVRVIGEEEWEEAKRGLKDQFRGSSNLELCLNMINDFEAVNPKYKYATDLEIFVRESKMEDFYGEKTETVFVSTMHKAKGREFDNVFLLLDRYDMEGMGDENRRLLYVALTRAKSNMSIHCNSGFFEPFRVRGIVRECDRKAYTPPNQLVLQLSHRDVWLDYFSSARNMVSQLKSGDPLTIDGEWCRNAKGKAVLKFSRNMINRFEAWRKKNYVPKSATVRWIVFWKKEDPDQEFKIVLPEILLERGNDSQYI